jgi:hypothetical protein
MGLSVFNSAKKTTAITDSLLGIGNGFIIYLNKNKFWSTNTDKWRLPGLEYFTGINLENISLNFQTNWGDAGGAILGKKIADYMNSKFIKFLAGQSEQGFQEFICSDAWTQQKVSGEASPIKVELKFRAYNEDKMGCTNYNDIIKFLIHICSPVRSATGDIKHGGIEGEEGLGDKVFENLTGAVSGASSIISTVIQAGKGFADTQPEGVTNAIKSLVNIVDKTHKQVVSETGNGKNNGNFTVLLTLGNLNKNNPNATKISRSSITTKVLPPVTDEPEPKKEPTTPPTEPTPPAQPATPAPAPTEPTTSPAPEPKKEEAKTTETVPATNTNNIDWIVESFNFQPSREFKMVGDLPKPLWVDFTLSLSTRLSLSNKYVYLTLLSEDLKTNVMYKK